MIPFVILFLLLSCGAVKHNPFYGFRCTEGEPLRAVWVWDAGLLELNRGRFERAVKRWGIGRVYLQMSGKVDEDTLSYLKGLGLEVFLVEGGRELDETFNPERAVSLGADGYQIDLEPYTKSDFWPRKGYYLRKYLGRLRELKKRAGRVAFSVVIPHWFDRLRFGSKSMTEHVFEIADEVVVMAYREAPRRIFSLIGEERRLSLRGGKPLLVGLEAIYTEGADTYPLSLSELQELLGMECAGIGGFVIQSVEGIL
jgi:hypothetical protein